MTPAQSIRVHIQQRSAELEYLKSKIATTQAEMDQLRAQEFALDGLIKGMETTLTYLKLVDPEDPALAGIEPAREIPF